MTGPGNNHAKAGFTLIEMLVAMALLSLVLMTLFSAFSALSASSRRLAGHITREESTHTGLNAMIADLEQVFIPDAPRYRHRGLTFEADPYRFEGKQISLGGRSFSTLSFTSVNRAPIGAAPFRGIARITYYVHRSNGRLDLHRADRAWPFDDPPDPCADPILIPGISGFSLTYAAKDPTELDRTDKDQTELRTWDPDPASSLPALPEQVAIEIAYEENGRTKTLETAVVLPAAGRVLP